MQVLTDTYGRILTQYTQDGDYRTACVYVPGDSRIDWDTAADQELVTLLSKYGYNDAITFNENNVTISDNGETETLIWDSAAMDFTADVDMFQNGAQNMYFRTVNDGNRDVTVLVDADGKAIVAPTLGEYNGVLFSVANDGTEIDTITSESSISAAAVIEACGGSVNVTAINAGDSVFLLSMGTHVQYVNTDNTTTTPKVDALPLPASNLYAIKVGGSYWLGNNQGKALHFVNNENPDWGQYVEIAYDEASQQWDWSDSSGGGAAGLESVDVETVLSNNNSYWDFEIGGTSYRIVMMGMGGEPWITPNNIVSY